MGLRDSKGGGLEGARHQVTEERRSNLGLELGTKALASQICRQ